MDEKELIKLSLQGDEKAFSSLMLLHQEMVFRHCLSIVKDEEIAQDLKQEAFLHAYQHLNTFRMEAKFSTWIWRIAHNLCLNYLKKRRLTELPYKEELLSEPPARKEIDPEMMQKIHEGLNTLAQEHRIVFEMYELQGMPQKQIAAQLNVPYGTVRSRLHYARKKLRDFLK